MEEINKEFVTYEQALALKELGFYELCFTWYWDDIGMYNGVVYANHNKNPNYVSAPLKQQVFRWFRDKCKLHSTITSISQESWQWHITKPSECLGKLYEEDFYNYEEAEDACINTLIEIVKNESKKD